MGGFVKLHQSIFMSSLMNESIEVRYVWMALLAAADRRGRVEGHRSALARLFNVPRDVLDHALDVLMAPDPESRTPDEDGRRVIAEGPQVLRIVNYAKYRAKEDPDDVAERKRRQRARERRSSDGDIVPGCAENDDVTVMSRKVTESHGKSRSAEAEAEAEAEEEPPPNPPLAADAAALSHGSRLKRTDVRALRRFAEATGFAPWWDLYGVKRARAEAEWAWYKLAHSDRSAIQTRTVAYLERRRTAQKAGAFVPEMPNPATYLNQRRWDDEFPAVWRASPAGMDPTVGAAAPTPPSGWRWGYSRADLKSHMTHPQWEDYCDDCSAEFGWEGERGSWPQFEDWLAVQNAEPDEESVGGAPPAQPAIEDGDRTRMRGGDRS